MMCNIDIHIHAQHTHTHTHGMCRKFWMCQYLQLSTSPRLFWPNVQKIYGDIKCVWIFFFCITVYTIEILYRNTKHRKRIATKQ